ncbi:hypothetical protein [Medusavirus stheno T3]|uniref:Uncharacterized protein n=1 Tax=Medusavirus stheno T3 TaxID=3069717 RepID=A0A7S7YEK3_9VIRU|nr:hypothetical protein QKU73_gp162 [Acanthamoeba castellanii medusavirus]QPB44343.1 hypothetical protein [Medusavirus stheno T3]
MKEGDQPHSALAGLDQEIKQLRERISQEATAASRAKLELRRSREELERLKHLRSEMEMTIEEAENIVINLINDCRRRTERLNSSRKRPSHKTTHVEDFQLRTQGLVEAFGTALSPYSCESGIRVECDKGDEEWVYGAPITKRERLAFKRVGITWRTRTIKHSQPSNEIRSCMDDQYDDGDDNY